MVTGHNSDIHSSTKGKHTFKTSNRVICCDANAGKNSKSKLLSKSSENMGAVALQIKVLKIINFLS